MSDLDMVKIMEANVHKRYFVMISHSGTCIVKYSFFISKKKPMDAL